jgi:hypothetical protein
VQSLDLGQIETGLDIDLTIDDVPIRYLEHGGHVTHLLTFLIWGRNKPPLL